MKDLEILGTLGVEAFGRVQLARSSFYGSMQDDKHNYFVLEELLGGQLFKVLRAENQFPESWSKFYAASVLLAFRDIHSKKIAFVSPLKLDRDFMTKEELLNAVVGGELKSGAHDLVLYSEERPSVIYGAES